MRKKRTPANLINDLAEGQIVAAPLTDVSTVDEYPQPVLSVEEKQKQTEKLEEKQQSVKKQKSKKNKIWSIVFLIVNVVVVAYIFYSQFSSNEVVSLNTLFSDGFNWWYLLVTLIMYIIFLYLETYPISRTIKAYTKKSRPYLSYKVMMLGKYYDDITPLAAGGQPFQIVYLKNRGLDASTAISVPMTKYVISQIAWLVFSIICVVFCIKDGLLSSSKVVGIIGVLGFTAVFVLNTAVIILSVSKNIGKKIVIWILKTLQKMRIIKNYEKQYEKVMKVVTEYQETMQACAKNGKLFFKILISCFLKQLVYYSIPFAIYCTLTSDFNFALCWQFMVITVMIDLAAGVIPLPGGTGMNELSFTAVFSSFFGGKVFWALIMWRMVNLYLNIIQGLIIIFYDYARGNKKYQWQKKRWELEAESNLFMQSQLKGYKKKSANAISRKH